MRIASSPQTKKAPDQAVMPSRGFVYILPQEYVARYPDHSFHVYETGSIPQRMDKGFEVRVDDDQFSRLRKLIILQHC